MVEPGETIPEVIIVDVIVAGVADFRGKMRISLTIPVFRSDYPTNCTDFPDGMDRAVTVGDPYRLELRRQSLVKGREGAVQDGSKPFHYYWGITGSSKEPLTVFAQQHSTSTSYPPSGNGLRSDPAGISIERQVAYKGAVELAVARIKTGETITMAEVLVDTDMAAATIHGGPVVQDGPDSVAPAPDPQEAPTGDATQQEAFDSLGGNHQEAEGEIGNLSEFMTKAQQGGHGYSAKILQKLGVSRPVEILDKYGTFDAALKKLATP